MPFVQSFQKTGYGIFASNRRRQIQYVGSTVANSIGTATNLTINLANNITPAGGGNPISPIEGDLIVIAHCWSSTVDRAMAPVTAGYTVHTEQYANGSTYDANLGVYSKFMGPTPDTSVVIPATVSSADSSAVAIQVWRNVDRTETSPADLVNFTTALNVSKISYSARTLSNTENSVVILVSAAAGAFSGQYTGAPTGTSNLVTTWGNDTNDSVIGMASYVPTIGENRTFTAFTGPADASGQSASVGTLTLRASF